MPFKLEMNLSPPEFMEVAFVSLYGGSELVTVRSMTLESLQRFVEVNGHRTHPRLRTLVITGPEGVIEEIDRRKVAA